MAGCLYLYNILHSKMLNINLRDTKIFVFIVAIMFLWMHNTFVMELDKNKPHNGDSQVGRGNKKNSTTEIPLVGLDEVADFVATIHDKALEVAPMPDVARGVGYEGATSTPFYRRLVASRLFGLIGQGAAITKRGNDYLKPDQEDAKANALQDAISGISYYATLIEKYKGRKLNPDLVRNAIARDFNLTDVTAGYAAKAFADSLKFAGLLFGDGVVGSIGETPKVIEHADNPSPIALSPINFPGSSDFKAHMTIDHGTHTYELPLDKENKRKVKLNAPLDINAKEVKRVTKWIEATLLIDDAGEQEQ